MYHSFFICSCVHGHLSYFHVLVIVTCIRSQIYQKHDTSANVSDKKPKEARHERILPSGWFLMKAERDLTYGNKKQISGCLGLGPGWTGHKKFKRDKVEFYGNKYYYILIW